MEKFLNESSSNKMMDYIKKNIVDIACEPKNIDVAFSKVNVYLNTESGAEGGYAGAVSTDFIEANGSIYAKITYMTNGYGLYFYDKNKNFIKYENRDAVSQNTIYTLSIPSNAMYIRFSYYTSSKELSAVKLLPSKYDISEYNYGQYTQVGYLQDNGINTGGVNMMSRIIQIPKGYTLVAYPFDSNGCPQSGSTYRVCEDTFSFGTLTSNGSIGTSIATDDKDKYVIFLYNNAGADKQQENTISLDIRLYKNDDVYYNVFKKGDWKKSYTNKNNYAQSLKKLGRNVICIGDSITEGVLATGTAGDRNPYPSVLAELTGWNVTNAGCASRTAVSWITDKMPDVDMTNKDIAVVYFSTNDTTNGTCSGDLEGDTDFSSYNDYKLTTEGQYCKIIEILKEKNPSIKIYMIAGGYGSKVMNDSIRAIASKYGLKVIYLDDPSDGVLMRDSKFHSDADGIHFNQLGYCAFATKVLNGISKYMFEYRG